MNRGKNGFTLIELMLVVAVIGLLAGIAIPKFANMVTKAKEAAIMGQLGAMRSALSLYYADNEGNCFPSTQNFNLGIITLKNVLEPKYMGELPINISLPNTPHPHNNGTNYQSVANHWPINLSVGFDVGTWIYLMRMDMVVGKVIMGDVAVSCTHFNSKGERWSTK